MAVSASPSMNWLHSATEHEENPGGECWLSWPVWHLCPPLWQGHSPGVSMWMSPSFCCPQVRLDMWPRPGPAGPTFPCLRWLAEEWAQNTGKARVQAPWDRDTRRGTVPFLGDPVSLVVQAQGWQRPLYQCSTCKLLSKQDWALRRKIQWPKKTLGTPKIVCGPKLVWGGFWPLRLNE
jgi:hypothetical protein